MDLLEAGFKLSSNEYRSVPPAFLNEGYGTEMRPLPHIETILLRSSSGRGSATGTCRVLLRPASWPGLATVRYLGPGSAKFGRAALVGLDFRCPLLLFCGDPLPGRPPLS